MKKKLPTIIDDVAFFLNHLKIPFHRRWLNKRFELAEFHTIPKALNQILDQLNIENLVVKLPKEQLYKIPLPALGLMKNRRILTITKVENEQITITATDQHTETLPINTFINNWSGLALIAETKSSSGQPKLKEYKSRLFYHLFYRMISVIILLSSLFFILTFSNLIQHPNLIALLGIKLTGAVICVVLIRRGLDNSNQMVNKLCHINQSFDCKNVIHSKASKIMGISMSEFGLFYFGGTALSLLLFSLIGTPEQLFPIFSIFVFLNLSYALFSMYYQWWVIGKWCPLCLAVLAIFLLEALLVLPINGYPFFDSIFHLAVFIISMTIIPTLWFWIKPSILISLKAKEDNKRLNLLEFNSNVQRLFLAAKGNEINHIPTGIIIGNPDSSNTLSLLLNPECEACRLTFQQARLFQKTYPEQLKLNIHFLINPGKIESDKQVLIVNNIVDSYRKDPSEGIKSLDHFMENKGIRKMRNHHQKLSLDNEIKDQLHKSYEYWNSSGLTSTPAAIWNERPIPHYYVQRLPLIRRVLLTQNQ
ncbi:MAG: cysteine peptidase family C39 domain-containing protein [Chitinophagales bacterium]|nr:cysteine peptidase family C39 domain-containing protein [Chitinophagales bacterium]